LYSTDEHRSRPNSVAAAGRWRRGDHRTGAEAVSEITPERRRTADWIWAITLAVIVVLLAFRCALP
jgi:hypothetical protein